MVLQTSAKWRVFRQFRALLCASVHLPTWPAAKPTFLQIRAKMRHRRFYAAPPSVNPPCVCMCEWRCKKGYILGGHQGRTNFRRAVLAHTLSGTRCRKQSPAISCNSPEKSDTGKCSRKGKSAEISEKRPAISSDLCHVACVFRIRTNFGDHHHEDVLATLILEAVQVTCCRQALCFHESLSSAVIVTVHKNWRNASQALHQTKAANLKPPRVCRGKF